MLKLKKMPYMPLYSDDWLASRTVSLLPLDAQGLFIRCLLVQWEGGELPKSPDEIALLVGNPPGFAAAWEKIAKLFQNHGKGIANKRGLELKEEWDALRRERATAGKHGNDLRWQNSSKPPAKSSPSDPLPSPPDSDPIPSPPDGEAADAAARPDVNAALEYLNSRKEPEPVPPPPPRSVKPPRERKHLPPPSDDDLAAYGAEIGIGSIGNGDELIKFKEHYTTNGWMAGKVKMVDWQSALRKWMRTAQDFAPRVAARGRR